VCAVDRRTTPRGPGAHHGHLAQGAGPGRITVTPSRVSLASGGQPDLVLEAAAAATFSAPGEYILRAEPVERDDGFDGPVLCDVRADQGDGQVAASGPSNAHRD
jgi:hypothetical protein